MAKFEKTFVDGQPLTAADLNGIKDAANTAGDVLGETVTDVSELASVVAQWIHDNADSQKLVTFGASDAAGLASVVAGNMFPVLTRSIVEHLSMPKGYSCIIAIGCAGNFSEIIEVTRYTSGGYICKYLWHNTGRPLHECGCDDSGNLYFRFAWGGGYFQLLGGVNVTMSVESAFPSGLTSVSINSLCPTDV